MTALSFNQAAVNELFARLVSPCKQLGAFRSNVIQHEPRTAPSADPALALWWASITPPKGYSGLAATSARVEFGGRVYLNYRRRAEEDTDPLLLTLVSQVLGAFTGAFTLDGDVAFVDLQGAYGAPLAATAAYANYDGSEFRVADLVIPVIADDVWTQEA